MMADFKLTADVEQITRGLGAQASAFGDLSHTVRKAAANAVNRSLAHMRTEISSQIRKTYYVKKQDLDAAIHLSKARPGNVLQGTLAFSGRGVLPLSFFGAQQRKTFVSVKILRANRARRIRPGGDHHILATQKKGRAAVWIAKGQVLARTADSADPVALYGPSFMSFFNGPGVPEDLQRKAGEFFRKRLAAELNFYAGKGR